MTEIQVYTSCRQVPARRLRRPRYLTNIALQCNSETPSLKERMKYLTVKMVEVCLLRAEVEHLKRLHQRLGHLHLQRGLPATQPALQYHLPSPTYPRTTRTSATSTWEQETLRYYRQRAYCNCLSCSKTLIADSH